MVNACFCAAFGVALEGLIIVSYVTVIASGVSDETIGLLAKGELGLLGSGRSSKPAATLMAFPVILTTYSSLFLLLGLVTMVAQTNTGAIFDYQANGYHTFTLLPIVFGFVCICIMVFFCELGTHREFKARRKHLIYQGVVQASYQAVFPPLQHTASQEDIAPNGEQQGSTRHSRNDSHTTQMCTQLEGGHGEWSQNIIGLLSNSSACLLKASSLVRPTQLKRLVNFNGRKAKEAPSLLIPQQHSKY